ncbi:MAG: dual specificity protein phosphatase [Chloroflexota bacterium]
MIEISSHLYVGDQGDGELILAKQSGWAIVHACKEPYHRRTLGYATPGAPKGHPEYLFARRGNRLIMNIVDAPNPAFFAKEMIDVALDFIDEMLGQGLKVLVHCNQGESRSPSIALLYLASRKRTLPIVSLEAAEDQFRLVYPNYNPKSGIHGFLSLYWGSYCHA